MQDSSYEDEDVLDNFMGGKKYMCVLFPFVSHRILKDDINPLLRFICATDESKTHKATLSAHGQIWRHWSTPDSHTHRMMLLISKPTHKFTRMPQHHRLLYPARKYLSVSRSVSSQQARQFACDVLLDKCATRNVHKVQRYRGKDHVCSWGGVRN